MRTVIHLNNDWMYKDDFCETYVSTDFDDKDFQKVRLPHTNIEIPYNNFDENIFQFVSCYRKSIFLDENAKGKRVIFHFEGVMSYAQVFMNGHKIGCHKGGYTPFKCDATDYIKLNSNNHLVVKVDSSERDDIPPFGNTIDYLTYGGIYREVRLEIVETISIENLQFKAKEVLSKKPKLELFAYIENSKKSTNKITLTIDMLSPNGSKKSFERQLALTGSFTEKHEIFLELENIELWSPDNPVLYDFVVKLSENETSIDQFEQKFGFRTIDFNNQGFFINGKRMKLRGLNRHQSFPYVGYAMPKSAQYKDAEILKYELGVNIVRTSHYPQSKHFLNRCDELGLLVFEEIPGWQYIGDEEWKQLAILSVEEMIKRDWNHPSIVMWGVRINESDDDDNLYKETNGLARELDNTRPTGGVRNFDGSNFLEDVFTYNDFFHRGNNSALLTPQKMRLGKAAYMVTEHNGHMFPTKKFDCEERRVEHGLRHMRVLDQMYSNHMISGAIGWCMFDYNTHKDFGSGDKICYHGVMDMFRIPKEAAAVYASQHEDKTVMEVASSMNRGEWNASEIEKVHVFTNCDYVKVYKNDEFIGTYYPDKKMFPNVPYPPIIIKDFIGNLIEKHEGISKRDSEAIKRMFFAIVKYGEKLLPLRYKLKMLYMMMKLRISFKDGAILYMKYITNWGCKSIEYRFDGFKKDHCVATVTKGASSSADLRISPDSFELHEEETYDTTRIVLKHIDRMGNVMTFSNETVQLEIQGVGEIIGPKQISLVGGSSAFWIKTIGIAGEITVRIKSNICNEKVIKMSASVKP